MNDLVLAQRSALAKAETAVMPCSKDVAKEAGAMLVGGFPQQKNNDAKAFIWHVRSLMLEYPADLVEEAAVKVPREIEGWLTINKLQAWLEAKMKHRRDMLRIEQQRMADITAANQSEAAAAEIEAGREAYRSGKMKPLKDLIAEYREAAE